MARIGKARPAAYPKATLLEIALKVCADVAENGSLGRARVPTPKRSRGRFARSGGRMNVA